jgi:hypothetical protein
MKSVVSIMEKKMTKIIGKYSVPEEQKPNSVSERQYFHHLETYFKQSFKIIQRYMERLTPMQ